MSAEVYFETHVTSDWYDKHKLVNFLCEEAKTLLLM